jgi:tetratricopeptide (TPR) repeat protein
MDTLTVSRDSLRSYSPSIQITYLTAKRLIAYAQQDYCTAASILREEASVQEDGTKHYRTNDVFQYAYLGLYYSLCGDSTSAISSLMSGSAIALTEEDEARDPNQARLDRAYGEYFRLTKRLDSSLSRFSRAIAHYEQHPKSRRYELGGAFAGYGRVLCEVGRYEDACEYLQRAKELGTSSVSGFISFTPFMYQYAKALSFAGRYDQAEDEYLNAIRWQVKHIGEYHPSIEPHLEELISVSRKLDHTEIVKNATRYLSELRKRKKRSAK